MLRVAWWISLWSLWPLRAWFAVSDYCNPTKKESVRCRWTPSVCSPDKNLTSLSSYRFRRVVFISGTHFSLPGVVSVEIFFWVKCKWYPLSFCIPDLFFFPFFHWHEFLFHQYSPRKFFFWSLSSLFWSCVWNRVLVVFCHTCFLHFTSDFFYWVAIVLRTYRVAFVFQSVHAFTYLASHQKHKTSSIAMFTIHRTALWNLRELFFEINIFKHKLVAIAFVDIRKILFTD